MLPYILEIDSLKISTFGFFAALAFFAASFLLWKQLRDDYSEEDILTFTIDLFLAGIIGARLLFVLENISYFGINFIHWFLWGKYPGFTLPGAILGAAAFCYYWAKKKNWDLWLTADKMVIVFFLVQAIGGIGLVLSTGNHFDLVRLIISFVFLPISVLLAKNYRKFLWYKSGKVGFVAGSSFGFYFLLLGLLEFLKTNSIYLDRILYFLFSLICFYLIYKRSERNWKEDLTNAKTKFISR